MFSAQGCIHHGLIAVEKEQKFVVQNDGLGEKSLVLEWRWSKKNEKKKQRGRSTKHTAAGIPTWSPTVVLICRSTAYVWQSGRDAQFSADCG
ncbi:hypothetical protein KCU98_g22208, partial [Aureobasidium melanogenum]